MCTSNWKQLQFPLKKKQKMYSLQKQTCLIWRTTVPLGIGSCHRILASLVPYIDIKDYSCRHRLQCQDYAQSHLPIKEIRLSEFHRSQHELDFQHRNLTQCLDIIYISEAFVHVLLTPATFTFLDWSVSFKDD